MFALPKTVPTSSILFQRVGSSVAVTLNRPAALNSINLDMVRLLAARDAFWRDPETSCFVMKGAGAKAFCAGGDIRDLCSGGGTAEGLKAQDEFFRDEYSCDYHLAQNTKTIPIVALYDGIVMGGGVGVSIHSTFRVATEKTMFAMPETGIGFFPDVGGSFFLPRLPNPGFGRYLALTGARLTGADTVIAGIATHFVPSASIPDLEAALAALPAGRPEHATEAVREILERFQRFPENHPGLNEAKVGRIGEWFTGQGVDGPSPYPGIPTGLSGGERHVAGSTGGAGGDHGVEIIIDTLKSAGDEVAGKALTAMTKASPTSLKVTLEQMRRGGVKGMTMADCFQLEMRMALRFMAPDSDFYEGVNALLVRKDGKPAWKRTLDQVTPALIAEHFAPLADPSKELVMA